MFKTFDTVLEDFETWRNTYGRFIRMIDVCFADGDASKFLLEHTMELSIDEIWAKLCEAEETLPTSLDYLLGRQVPSKRTDPLAGYKSLDKILGHLEHLGGSSIPLSDSDPASERLSSDDHDWTSKGKH